MDLGMELILVSAFTDDAIGFMRTLAYVVRVAGSL